MGGRGFKVALGRRGARICAKEPAMAYRPKSTVCAIHYNTLAREIRAILKINPRNRHAAALLKAVNTAVNMKKKTPSSKRRTTGIVIPLR